MCRFCRWGPGGYDNPRLYCDRFGYLGQIMDGLDLRSGPARRHAARSFYSRSPRNEPYMHRNRAYSTRSLRSSSSGTSRSHGRSSMRRNSPTRRTKISRIRSQSASTRTPSLRSWPSPPFREAHRNLSRSSSSGRSTPDLRGARYRRFGNRLTEDNLRRHTLTRSGSPLRSEDGGSSYTPASSSSSLSAQEVR